jgi:hypothetical protein
MLTSSFDVGSLKMDDLTTLINADLPRRDLIDGSWECIVGAAT